MFVRERERERERERIVAVGNVKNRCSLMSASCRFGGKVSKTLRHMAEWKACEL